MKIELYTSLLSTNGVNRNVTSRREKHLMKINRNLMGNLAIMINYEKVKFPLYCCRKLRDPISSDFNVIYEQSRLLPTAIIGQPKHFFLSKQVASANYEIP